LDKVIEVTDCFLVLKRLGREVGYSHLPIDGVKMRGVVLLLHLYAVLA